MKRFITPTTAKLTAKKAKITHETITIFHTSLPITSTCKRKQNWNMNVNKDVKPKAIAIRKKSCGFMVPRYVMFIALTFKFWLLSSIKKFYFILYNISREIKCLTFSDKVSRETFLLGGLGKWG